MSKVLVEETSLQNIANSIREKTGTEDTYKPSEMATAISNIETGGGKYAPRQIRFTAYGGTELDYELENLDTSNITYMNNIFSSCKKLINLDLSSFNTSNVTTMNNLFSSCNALESIVLSSFNTSNVTDMSSMFYECYSLIDLDLSNFNVTKLTNTQSMFMKCEKLENINFKDWNTSALTRCNQMFYNCYALLTLDLSDFDTSNVTTMENMFYNCYALTSLDVSSFNTSKVTSFNSTFTNCQALTSLDLSSFDFSKATSISMFHNNYALKNLQFGSNLGKGFTSKQKNAYSLSFTNCNQLTHDSLMDVINKVYDLNLTYDVANGGTLYTQKIEFGSKNIAKLTSEEIAIATAKGWTIL